MAVVRDRRIGSVTAVLRVRGHGFPLASHREQDAMLAGWSAALSPFARERSPVSAVAWQEWAHPVGADDHRSFLASVGVDARAHEQATADYLALIDQQAPRTVAHVILLSVTVDQRRARVRRSAGSRLQAALDALDGEMRLFQGRLDAAGLTVDKPLSTVELSTAIRVRSDPSRSRQVTSLARSLAAAARRGALEWGPILVETDRAHVLELLARTSIVVDLEVQSKVRRWVLAAADRYNDGHHWPHPTARRGFPPPAVDTVGGDA